MMNMKETRTAFYRRGLRKLSVAAAMLVAGIAISSTNADAQVAKRPGTVPGTSGPVIVTQPQPTTVPAPVPYNPPTYTPSYPNYTPTYSSATRREQIRQRLEQIRQQREQLRQEEQSLRGEAAQIDQATGQVNGNAQPTAARHDNGKHKGWYKNGKANANNSAYRDRDDD